MKKIKCGGGGLEKKYDGGKGVRYDWGSTKKIKYMGEGGPRKK